MNRNPRAFGGPTTWSGSDDPAAAREKRSEFRC